MKQVVQNFRTGELKVEELPPPALRPGGVIVETAFSLISAGTERSIVETAQSSLIGKARTRPDLVRQVIDTFRREGLRSTYEKVKSRLNQIKALGYSASGIVKLVGSDVDDLRVGDRVACAGAGYASHAEVIFVPKNLVCKLPETVSLESACYTTVGSIALHGVRQADPRLGETVAVIGLGLVGGLTVQILKAASCRVVGIDIDPAACELGKRSGADAVASNRDQALVAVNSLSEGRGADSVIITASTNSNDPVELAGELARDRARVVVVGLVGMDIPRQSYYMKELELKLSRSYGPGRYDAEYEEKGSDYPIGYVRWTERRNMGAFLQLIAEGKVNTEILTTHRFTVEQAADAYSLIMGRGNDRYCGVLLEYPARERQEEIKSHRKAEAREGELGVSFIGAGNFARGVLLPVVRRSRGVAMVGLATATGISASNTAEQFGFSYSTTDYLKVLDDNRADCVFIATRHDTHARLATESLRRGRSVFLEKPLAITLDGLKEVAAAARESRGLLMVGYNRRFAPLAKQIKELLGERRGPMTIIYRINTGQLPLEHWSLDETEGGGRIIGEVCHFIDFIQFLTGSRVALVSAEAVAQTRVAGFLDDSCVVSIRMADGSIASIIYTASGDAALPKERVEIFCDRSVCLIDDFKSGEIIRGGKRRGLGGNAQDKGHAFEIGEFFDAVRRGGDAPISLDSLVDTSLTCFAILESARSGSKVSLDAFSEQLQIA
ncbi:MAG TPA: bi-domain-containing oxidoreductase [Blastocatellia bacterium]|nr:bi-domain-containing oxidoreductase [Blastocatellia bacterium]